MMTMAMMTIRMDIHITGSQFIMFEKKLTLRSSAYRL